jgi:hypothetical protein
MRTCRARTSLILGGARDLVCASGGGVLGGDFTILIFKNIFIIIKNLKSKIQFFLYKKKEVSIIDSSFFSRKMRFPLSASA